MKRIIRSGPPYLQVADQLREWIKSGKIGKDEKLPPYTTIAKSYSVAINTAKAAVYVLRDEGLVYIQHGKGSFVK